MDGESKLDGVRLAVDPLEWRRSSMGLVWRIAKPEDMPRLAEIHQQSGALLNPSPLPALDQPPVLLTLVAENEDGKIVYGAYVEAIPHIRAIGVHSSGFGSMIGIAGCLRSFLKGAGFRMVKVSMRRRLADLARPLLEHAGFVAEDRQGPVFHLDL